MKLYTTPEILKIELESDEIMTTSVAFGGGQAGDFENPFDGLF